MLIVIQKVQGSCYHNEKLVIKLLLSEMLKISINRNVHII